MKKKAVETVENKKHISHRFHSTAATTATVIYFLKMCNLRVTILMKTFLSLVKESNGFFKRICRKLLTQLRNPRKPTATDPFKPLRVGGGG